MVMFYLLRYISRVAILSGELESSLPRWLGWRRRWSGASAGAILTRLDNAAAVLSTGTWSTCLTLVRTAELGGEGLRITERSSRPTRTVHTILHASLSINQLTLF